MPEPELELFVDLTNDELQQLIDQYQQLRFKVEKKRQRSGKWALAAAKCD